MGKTLLISFTNVAEGESDEAFNKWFNEVHGPEVLQIPGFNSLTRFKVVSQPVPPGATPEHQYVSIFELDDAERGMKALAAAAPGFTHGDALDMKSAKAFLCEQLFTLK